MVFALNSIVTLTFDLVTSKFKEVIYWPWPIFLQSTMTVTHKLSIYWADMIFALNGIVTLTFDLVTSKCIGVIYWPWPIFLPSTMTVTHKLLKILSGHDVANGRTDGRTDGWKILTDGHLLGILVPNKCPSVCPDRRTDGRTPYHNTSEVLLRAYKKACVVYSIKLWSFAL